MITGIRGLCNGLGPAMFGFVFYLFDVNVNEVHDNPVIIKTSQNLSNVSEEVAYIQKVVFISINATAPQRCSHDTSSDHNFRLKSN